MFTKSLLISALAGVALSTPAPAITPAPIYQRQQQSDSSLTLECQAQYESMIARAPNPSKDSPVIQWLNSEDILRIFDSEDVNGMCSAMYGDGGLKPPASVASAWSSYMSEANDYASSMAEPASSLKSKCPATIGAAIALLAITDENSCKTAYAAYSNVLGGTTEGGSSPTTMTGPARTTTLSPVPTVTTGPNPEDEDEGGNENENVEEGGNAQTTSTSTAGGARETGFVVAAAAAMAVAGGMAAL
ncbi:hypothetical protein QC762_118000 [Podospora pseudocomata]|uniref:Infection structure specific protein n=1 Tax=Podospora pseudocomata TaxID=2093779 RepID=A0ABR0GX57_9PEZI|nr:hypothetical protein QC762_118000 [Podospora pseudocomata]